MTDSERDFLARGGKITHVDPAFAYGVDKDADTIKRAAAREQRLIDERHVVIGSGGREYVRNGLGEWV